MVNEECGAHRHRDRVRCLPASPRNEPENGVPRRTNKRGERFVAKSPRARLLFREKPSGMGVSKRRAKVTKRTRRKHDGYPWKRTRYRFAGPWYVNPCQLTADSHSDDGPEPSNVMYNPRVSDRRTRTMKRILSVSRAQSLSLSAVFSCLSTGRSASA